MDHISGGSVRVRPSAWRALAVSCLILLGSFEAATKNGALIHSTNFVIVDIRVRCAPLEMSTQRLKQECNGTIDQRTNRAMTSYRKYQRPMKSLF